LPPEEMTTTEFSAALSANNRVGPHLSEPIVEFFLACDQRKFSPSPAPAPQSAVAQALSFIELAQKRLDIAVVRAGRSRSDQVG
jgi:hypothetical protein